jgi:hypothetical protein
MENRKARQAKLKTGPGTFKYIGGEFDTHAEPTVLKTSKRAAKLDENGAPVFDRAGRAVMEPAGTIVRDDRGNPMLGGPPIVSRKERDPYVVRRIEFPKGKAVLVEDESLALKLRGMECFEEVGAKRGKKAADGEATAEVAE